jgi:hypothetical protein
MKPVNEVETRTIHPDVFKDISVETALVMLEIARDFRSGVIPPEQFFMPAFHAKCGTAHCIAGWVEVRTGKSRFELFKSPEKISNNLLCLFIGSHPSDPQKAADAIENYMFNYADRPWSTKTVG